ncbi:MAG: hypothetical protein OHK0039_19480 [Bacteroidia bacterium]
MHDIDRNLREAELEFGYEGDFELEGEDSFLNEILGDGEYPGGINDKMEADLAHELLSVSSNAKLD